MSAIEYIRYALNYLDNEDVRKSEYIKEDFHSELDLINYSSIIDNNIKGISQKETGFRAMLNNNKLEELRDSFYFVTRTGRKETLKVLTDSVEDYIKSEGDKLYNNAELKKDPTSKTNI